MAWRPVAVDKNREVVRPLQMPMVSLPGSVFRVPEPGVQARFGAAKALCVAMNTLKRTDRARQEVLAKPKEQ